MLYLLKSWLSALLKFRSYFHLTFMKTEPALQIPKKKTEVQTKNKNEIRFVKLMKQKPKFSCTHKSKGCIAKSPVEWSTSSA